MNNTPNNRFSFLDTIGNTPVAASASVGVAAVAVMDTSQPNTDVFKDAGSMLQVGTGRRAGVDGDGVMRNAIGLESTEALRHVALDWQKRCTPFDTFRANVDKAAGLTSDELVPESSVRLDAHLRLAGRDMAFTNYGLRCLSKYVGVRPSTIDDLLDNGYRDFVPPVLNSELDKRELAWAEKQDGRLGTPADPRSFLLRKKDTANGKVIRAVMSQQYGVLDNHEVMSILAGALAETGQVLASHAYTDGDCIILNLLLPDSLKTAPDSDYGVGIAIKNDEIGRYAYSVSPFLFRAICFNGNIWSRLNSTVNVSRKHLGVIDHEDLTARTRKAIALALSHGHEMMVQMGHLANVKVSNMQNAVALLCRDNGLTIAHGQAWLKGIRATQQAEPVVYEGTAHLLLNGLTRAAQGFSGETRNMLEETAGDLLTGKRNTNSSLGDVVNRWGAIDLRANELEEKLVRNYVIVAA